MDRLELTLCEFNLENLFVSMEYYEGQDLRQMTELDWRAMALSQLRRRQKPIAKLLALAEAIEDIDPDVLMLVEVGGRDSLENFNRHFLGGRYAPYFIEGNSRRAIDLAYLVKPGVPFRIEARSNRDIPIDVRGAHGKVLSRFSRDIAELRLFSAEGGLRLILLLVHLKSKLGSLEDFRGKDVRTAEATALAEFYSRLRSEQPDVPIIVGGDFNAEMGSLELELFNHTDLKDFHDMLGSSEEGRASLVYIDYAGKPHTQVLDHLLVSPHLRDRIVRERSFTYRYKGFYGIAEELPGNFREKLRLPSDHYPVVLTIEL
jgi:endonuclease/exonuclease/phosphatase family metal-dependent hydrolase